MFTTIKILILLSEWRRCSTGRWWDVVRPATPPSWSQYWPSWRPSWWWRRRGTLSATPVKCSRSWLTISVRNSSSAPTLSGGPTQVKGKHENPPLRLRNKIIQFQRVFSIPSPRRKRSWENAVRCWVSSVNTTLRSPGASLPSSKTSSPASFIIWESIALRTVRTSTRLLSLRKSVSRSPAERKRQLFWFRQHSGCTNRNVNGKYSRMESSLFRDLQGSDFTLHLKSKKFKYLQEKKKACCR